MFDRVLNTPLLKVATANLTLQSLFINPFWPNVRFKYSLKTSKDLSRGYGNGDKIGLTN